MIFDTHAHYDDEQFDKDRDDLLSSFLDSGINRVVNISSTLESITATLALCEKYDFIYGAVGIHPNEADTLDEERFQWMGEQLKHDKIVAVGEIGLDYHYDEPAPAIQKKWFERQLDLSREAGLPVVIHSREAAADTLALLKENHAEEIGGVIHCFSYGKEMAREYLNMGFYLGIGGVVTFKNARKLKEVVEYAPLDRLVLETDAPYLSPEPNRGKRNSSLNLPYVVKQIAELKQVPEEEIIRITTENAKIMYKERN